VGNLGRIRTERRSWMNQPQSMEITLPPLGVLVLAPEPAQTG
jgi:hypothetical protein